jgi:hypothetical protein
MLTVYYLTHCDSHRRLGYYTSRAGARIAQRSRNRRLGFHTRIERIELGELEYERCLDSENSVVDATWVIEEAVIDTVDLIEDSAVSY